jgi:hypothetical protein
MDFLVAAIPVSAAVLTVGVGVYVRRRLMLKRERLARLLVETIRQGI